jgi:hypothetical protein
VKWEKQYSALKMWRWPVAAVWRASRPNRAAETAALLLAPLGLWPAVWRASRPNWGRRDGGATLGNGCERNNIAMLGQHKAILVMTLLYLPLPI